MQRWILGGESFNAGEHDAVGDDERDENPQHYIQFMEIGVEHQVNGGDQCGDDEDENRNADFVRDKIAQRGNGDVGERHDDDGCKREHDTVYRIGGDSQQGAKTENLDERGVLLPDAVADNVA